MNNYIGNMNKYHYNTVIGVICIEESNNYITAIYLDENINMESERETKLIKNTYEQLMEYLQGKRTNFNIPIKLDGTEFQKKVWKELLEIPYGKTCSYKEIAQKIGNKNACRAVGGANNKNPIMIVVPCHRVVGKNGSLVGYASGLEVKRRLLDIELKFCTPNESTYYDYMTDK